MSDLNDKRWAVISYRGVEASGLSYEAAMNFRRSLDRDKVYGLCIVADEAARRDEKDSITTQQESGSKDK